MDRPPHAIRGGEDGSHGLIGDVLARRVYDLLVDRVVTIVAQHVGLGGGMERQCAELVKGYLAANWSVTVVARECDISPDPRLRFVRVRGPYRPFSLGFPWFFVVGSLLTWRHRRGLLHVNGAIVGNRADIATVHFSHRAFARLNQPRRGSRATRLHLINARVVGALVRAAERWCYRPCRVTHLVGVSAGVSREILALYPYCRDEVTVIPCGVDGEAFRPDPPARELVMSELLKRRDDGASIVLFVGGEWDRKGLAAVIAALRLAPGWVLLVVGEGDVSAARARAEHEGVGDRVYFLGRRQNPAALFAAADAFCLPTLYETFCMAAHEAASAGLPLLVTRVSGVEDLLVDGESGWFIVRDAPDISRRLRELRRSPIVAARMGGAARRASERYRWDDTVRSHLALYERLSETRPQPTTSDRKTVLVVMPLGEQRGGAELMLRHLVQYGRESGLAWVVVFLESGPMVEEFRRLGVKVVVVEAGRLRQLHRVAVATARIALVARKEQAIVVFGWMVKGQVYGGLAAIASRRSAVWYQVATPGRRDWLARCATLLPASGVLTLSRAGERAQGAIWPFRPQRMVYPGVELERFDARGLPAPSEVRERLGLPTEGPLVGIVSRLQRWKGVHVVIDAMALVRRLHPATHCVVVGGSHELDPEYPDELKRQVADLGLESNVTFAGLQSNVAVWMQAMDIVVHASDAEPFGIVVIEAMALGKPVVAGSAGGPREIITDHVDGLLVSYGDAAGLADAVRLYLEDPEFARSVGLAAQRRAAGFSATRYAENVISALKDLNPTLSS